VAEVTVVLKLAVQVVQVVAAKAAITVHKVQV
jgi:hypothetical protein